MELVWNIAAIRKENINESIWWSSVQHALAYLNVADNLTHRTEGESVLLDHVSKDVSRVLDLGTGDGRLLRLLKIDRPNMNEAIALDVSLLC